MRRWEREERRRQEKHFLSKKQKCSRKNLWEQVSEANGPLLN